MAPLTSSACRLGRAEATVLLESESEDEDAGEELRLSRGASGSDEFEELLPLLADELDREDDDELPGSPGLISARGPLSSEPETARRALVVLLLLEEDELFDEELDELFERPESSEFDDDDRRSRGRSGSLSSDELDERLDAVLVSSELEERLRTGLFGFDELPEDEAEEEEPLSVRGRGAMSSVWSDASECSSAVPSWIIEMDEAL